MGTGVSLSVWPPENSPTFTTQRVSRASTQEERVCMVKPHGRLVRVSYTHRCASTSRLSNWSSTRGIWSCRAGGTPNLGVGFPLRCIQRLSFPDPATQRCRWRDNWYTGGPYVLVLSY